MDGWIGQTLAGRYRVDAPLGRRDMAVVYKACDMRLGSDVALKVIRVDQFPRQC